MKLTNRNTMALAVTGFAVISLDLLAVLAAGPRVLDALQQGHTRTLFDAGATAARNVAVSASERMVELTGDLVVHALRGTAQAYGTLLRLAPEQRAVRRIRFLRTFRPRSHR